MCYLHAECIHILDAQTAKAILDANPVNSEIPLASTTTGRKQILESELTPAHRVFSLPELLDVIFSHIPTLSKSGRGTLRAAALTSLSLHHAAQLHLWRRPRDLNTVKQQVEFAFGAVIGEKLGVHVRQLRIRVIKGAWNVRLVTKIVELCPSIVEFTLYWGDAEDGSEKVTSDSVHWLSAILGLMPNLKHLTLAQFSWADVQSALIFPEDAHLPFSRLKTLEIRGFGWYFDVIARGLGSSLTSLDIGSHISSYESAHVVAIARRLTALTSLRIYGYPELHQLRLFAETAPGLEIIEVMIFDDRDDSYMAEIYSIIAGLPAIKEASMGHLIPARSAQIIQLARSSAPLEVLAFSVREDEEESAVSAALLELVISKRYTLKSINEWLGFKICADSRFIEALAACPQLERIGITFDAEKLEVSNADVEKLLTQCPHLRFTNELKVLVGEHPLCEARYKEYEKYQAAVIEELAEDILAN